MPKGCEFFEGGKVFFIALIRLKHYANKFNCNKHVIGFKGLDRTMRDIDMAVSRKYSQDDQCEKLKYQEKPLKRHPSFQICKILQCLKNKVSQLNSPWASIPFGLSFSFQKATRK